MHLLRNKAASGGLVPPFRHASWSHQASCVRVPGAYRVLGIVLISLASTLHHPPASAASQDPVNIPDAALRTCLETHLQLAPGATITEHDMSNLDSASCWLDVASLEGLQYATHLASASLGHSISDLSPLAGLTSLQSLILDRNNIADISPLSGLTSLTILSLTGNAIGDISALAGLTALETLWLDGNRVSDVYALAGLTSISDLYLSVNNVYDISALTANSGIGTGTTVD